MDGLFDNLWGGGSFGGDGGGLFGNAYDILTGATDYAGNGANAGGGGGSGLGGFLTALVPTLATTAGSYLINQSNADAESSKWKDQLAENEKQRQLQLQLAAMKGGGGGGGGGSAAAMKKLLLDAFNNAAMTKLQGAQAKQNAITQFINGTSGPFGK